MARSGPYLLEPAAGAVQIQPAAPADVDRRKVAPTAGKTVALDGATVVKGAILLPEDRLLVLAGARGRPVIADISPATGAVQWQHEIDEPGLTLAGGQRQANGGYLLVGHRSDPASREEQVWIGTVDRTGAVKARRTFPGRSASVAVAPNGRVALVYQRGGTMKVDVVLRGFTPALEDGSERVLLAAQTTPPPFKIAPLADGQFVVAGAENRGLWISRVTGEGAPVWLEKRVPASRADLEMVLNVDLLQGPKRSSCRIRRSS